MTKTAPLRAVPVDAPATEKPTVTPRRRKNADLRSREHLSAGEVESLIKAARRNRNGHRNSTMILIGFRHGIRVSELVNLRWDQIDFEQGVLTSSKVYCMCIG